MQIELKVQINFAFSIRRKEMINYSGVHVSLYTLLHFYYYMVRGNVTQIYPDLGTIPELCKPTYKIVRLEAVVVNVIL
jgi:hypothetical protein